MQQLPDLEKTDSKEVISCLKWTICNDRRNVCVNFQTDTDKLNTVVYRYQNSLYLEINGFALKLTGYQSFLAERVCLLNYIEIIFKSCILLDKTTVLN